MTFKEVAGIVFYVRDLGGPGSGNFGHAGRPGERGGSAKGGGDSSEAKSSPKIYNDKPIVQPVNPTTELGGEDLTISHFESRGYTTEQAYAIYDYKKNGFVSINKAAITGDCEKYDCDGASFLESAIDRSIIDYDIVTFHGMGNTESTMFDNLDAGSEFVNKSFYSTSLDKSVASGFSDSNKILVMSIPKGYKGIVMGDTKYESEVILQRNQKYKINKIDDRKTSIYYHVSPVAS